MQRLSQAGPGSAVTRSTPQRGGAAGTVAAIAIMSKKQTAGKGKKAAEAPAVEGHPMKDLLSKEMKIMHLTEKMKIFGKDTQEAHRQRKALEEEYTAYRTHQEDMTRFLNEKLDDQYNKIDQLEHQLVDLKLERSHFSSDMEAKFTEEATALQDDLTKASTKISALESELSSLSMFKSNKEALETKTARLEAELAMVKKETQQQLLHLDRQLVREKERMASEMSERIAETEKVTWAKWQSMYDDNTKKAMQKNKEMTVELQYVVAVAIDVGVVIIVVVVVVVVARVSECMHRPQLQVCSPCLFAQLASLLLLLSSQ